MLAVAKVNARIGREWSGNGIFTPEKLFKAAEELVLANADSLPAPITCYGEPMVANVQAPDRRPDPHIDTDVSVFCELYPTVEQIKLCVDAKYFFAMACGAGRCDEGLARAIADSGNDILIGDLRSGRRDNPQEAAANCRGSAGVPEAVQHGGSHHRLAAGHSRGRDHSVPGAGLLSGPRTRPHPWWALR